MRGSLPVAIGGDNILDPELLTDFFNAQMKSVCFELFASHIRHDSSWKSHKASSLVVSGVAPTISLLASPGSIAGRIFSCSMVSNGSAAMKKVQLTSYGAAPTLEASIGASTRTLVSIALVLRGCAVTAAAESALVSQGNVVRTCASLLSPRHLVMSMMFCERIIVGEEGGRGESMVFYMCLARRQIEALKLEVTCYTKLVQLQIPRLLSSSTSTPTSRF